MNSTRRWGMGMHVRFESYRRVLFALFMSAFVIGFFHRFAPGVLAERIASDFDLSATWLGAVAAAYFWTYTLMQLPAGVMIDRWGERRVVSIGLGIVTAGTIIFSLSSSIAELVVGRLMVGFGISALFVGILRSHARWYSGGQYTTVVGLTMLIGNIGALASAGPLAALLREFTWQSVMLSTAALTATITVATALLVRNKPEDLGFHPISDEPDDVDRGGYLLALTKACRNPRLFACLIAGVGTNGTFYAFAGLWGVPLLEDSFGLSTVAASFYPTVALGIYGIASFAVGSLADRFGARRPFIVLTGWLSPAAWAALVLWDWSPGWTAYGLYCVMGISAAQMVVVFASIKDMVAGRVAAAVLALANTCVFLAVAVIQPLVGWALDVTTAPGSGPGLAQYQLALSVCLVISIIAAGAASFIPETLQGRCRLAGPAAGKP